MKQIAKSNLKYLKLILSSILFLFLVIGVIVSPYITTLFYVIFTIFIFFLVLYILKYLLMPKYRIEIKEDVIIFKWVKINKKFSFRIEIYPEELLNAFELSKTTVQILTLKGEILLNEIIDVEKIVNELKEHIPDTANIYEYVINDGLAKINRFEKNYFCHYLYLYLNLHSIDTDYEDDVFDLFLALKFYNEFLKGKIEFFIISHKQYINRLKAFLNKLELGWIPTYLDNIFRIQPEFNDSFIDDLKAIFDDEQTFKTFNDTIVENASLILKTDQENDLLFCREIERYVKDNNLIEKLKKLDIKEHQEGE